MKRGVILLSILLCAVMTVSALEPTVTMSPSEFYETNSVDFQMNVSNNDDDYEINSLSLALGPLVILGMVDYKGWTENHDSSLATWSDGSIANNVYLSVFELLAKAPLVTEDTETTTQLTLVDDEGTEHTIVFPITIKNDETAPELSDPLPADAGFIKEGITDQPVHVTAVDPETGIANATLHYVRCNFEENITPAEHTHQLVQDGDQYKNTVDFSEYSDGQEVCFDFLAYNNGGDSSSYEGTVTVDGVPPEVFLIAPLDGDLVGKDAQFSFYASDNLASLMDCGMIIDDEVSLENISAANMDTVQIPSAEVDEGQHTWSITCFDQVGWQGDSETRTYTLDKTPPEIRLTSPENDSIVADTAVLQFEVSDNYQINQVWYVVDGNTTYVDDEEGFEVAITGWPSGPNELTVVAEDLVGNRNEQHFVVTIDRTAPQITLVSPEEGSTHDVHVDLVFSAEDDYDDTLDCTVFVDDSGFGISAPSGVDSVFERLIAVGDHSWSVVCVDDAGNEATTADQAFAVADMSGPDVVMDNPDVVIRGDSMDLSFDVSDISGVGDVSATIRGPDDSVQTISLERLGDSYGASIPTTMESTLGTYVLEVQAVDTLNNSNTAEDQILLTYAYAIELAVSPSSTSPSAGVVASGTVVKDDGSDVPETEALLLLPGANVTVTLENGMFSHPFNAPGSAGTYDVSLEVLSAENGQTYAKSVQLIVVNPVATGGSHGGGGHGGSSPKVELESSGCTTDWRCTAWTTCVDGEQFRVCVDNNGCSDEGSRKESKKCTMPKEEDDQDDKDTHGQSYDIIEAPIEPAETVTVDESPEDTPDAVGIGQASGFLGIGPAALVNVLFVLILLAVILATLKKIGFSKDKEKRLPVDRMGLEDYLERRHR